MFFLIQVGFCKDMTEFLKELYYSGLRDLKSDDVVAPFTKDVRRSEIIQTIIQSHYGRKMGHNICSCVQLYLPLW